METEHSYRGGLIFQGKCTCGERGRNILRVDFEEMQMTGNRTGSMAWLGISNVLTI